MEEARSFVGAGAGVNVFRKEASATQTTSQTVPSSSSSSTSTATASSTTKPQQFWAIKVGKTPGIYTSLPEARAQLAGTVKPVVKCFGVRARAEAWLRGDLEDSGSSQSSNTEVQSSSRSRTTLESFSSLPQLAGSKRKLAPEKPAAMSIAKHQKMSTLATREDESLSALLSAEKTHYANLKPGMDSLPPARPEPVIIFTDGSALGNGKKRAVAGVGVWFGHGDPRNISEPLGGPVQTNNRAELTAIIRAIESVEEKQDIKICSDSDYSIKCITQWSPTWIKKNWVNSSGKPVENRDLIETILNYIEGRKRKGSKTIFEWVKAHTNTKSGNDYADELATAGSRMHTGYLG
ncbi:ribonuclease H-like protein [Ascobolus immersus RN42]|uniref:Ribonuclease H n=1 Tax=Ascobolus immersus RN42 TaxID=1160509 RepID=A0A3N4HH84_ASCIM|nr:ribonuclease H-like protein [Ascobolus immersus RN42]